MSAIDKKVFWVVQTGSTLFWTFFVFIKFISLSFFWGTLCFLALFLSGLNLYGFYKCSKDYQKKVEGLKSNLTSGMFNMVLEKAKAGFGRFGGGGSNSNTGQGSS